MVTQMEFISVCNVCSFLIEREINELLIMLSIWLRLYTYPMSVA